jgi:hypothetical protein
VKSLYIVRLIPYGQDFSATEIVKSIPTIKGMRLRDVSYFP